MLASGVSGPRRMSPCARAKREQRTWQEIRADARCCTANTVPRVLSANPRFCNIEWWQAFVVNSANQARAFEAAQRGRDYEEGRVNGGGKKRRCKSKKQAWFL